ncbi:hypothetical protein DBR17_01520 [Sphingomonas sp. HMWF008]|nr:hypothetical protein DBR17_01520 [Sphingomonas sp. HMWF008]
MIQSLDAGSFHRRHPDILGCARTVLPPHPRGYRQVRHPRGHPDLALFGSGRRQRGLCMAERGRTRADRRVRPRCRCAARPAAAPVPGTPLRRRRSDPPHTGPGLSGHLSGGRASGKPPLDLMAMRIPWPVDAIARYQGARYQHPSGDLCHHAGSLVLPDPSAAELRDLESPEAFADEAGRRILVQLLGSGRSGTAERLIDRFGSLGAVLHASGEAVERAADARTRDILHATAAAIEHCLRARLLPKPISAPDKALIDYLVGTMGDCPREQVRVLYLDSGNHLLRAEIAAEGSPNQTMIAPRMIIARALQLEATALLLAHNHPGGEPHPSAADLRFTAQLARATRDLGIVLHDHLTIAGARWLSMRATGTLS